MFCMDLQLFSRSRFHPEGFDETNPLLEEDAVVPSETPVESVDEVFIDDSLEETVQEGQLEEQQTQSTGQQLPDDNIMEYLETMRQDIVNRLPAQQEQQAEPEGQTPEQIANENETWLEQFYDNPMAQVEALAEKIANKKLEPIMQERDMYQRQQQITQSIDEFKRAHPDLEEYTQDMVQIFQDQPDLESHPQALQIAYKMAKGNKFDSVPNSVEGYLKDDADFDKLLANPALKNKLIQRLMKEKQSSPPVMGTGGTSAGNATLADPKQITSYRDATKAWMAQDA